MGDRQVTDHSLFPLAAQHQGRLVTFYSRVQLEAVSKAQSRHLVVLRG